MNNKPCVLVVEDDNAMREMTVLALEDDYRVLAVGSGEEALLTVQRERPDVILLDVEMQPGMDGYATCQRLKADESLAAIPVIFVSGRDGIEDRLKGYEVGGDDYIVKPFELPELEAKLSMLLKRIDERAALSRMASYAGSTAMTAMTSMSEMGALLETMKKFSACSNPSRLADTMLAGLGLYGLRGTAQIRLMGEVLTRSCSGEASPLEASVIAQMANMDRIVQFKSRMSITSQTVSLLVHNMPIEDPDRCGRLRDHLAMLVDGAEARAGAIAAAAESEQRGASIERAALHITAALQDIDRAQRDHQVATRLAIEDIKRRMEAACYSLALTAAQEEMMSQELQSGLNQLLSSQNHVFDLQDQLSRIVKELKGFTA